MSAPYRPRRLPRLRREAWRTRLARARAMRQTSYQDRSLGWRLLVPGVFTLAGVLLVTSAVSSDGTDLRAGRYGDLSSVVRQQKAETDQLRAEAGALAAEIDDLSAALSDTQVDRAQEAAAELRSPAGLEAVHGPGLTVVIDDAPDAQLEAAGADVGKLIVHQQDIQAVANAMWAGGAEAMTIQGQRVISTTGIKCVGNTVVLHGIPYAPPYRLTAVGDPSRMLASLYDSPYIEIYLQYVERYQLGWQVETHADVALPAYEGPLELDYARPAGISSVGGDGEI